MKLTAEAGIFLTDEQLLMIHYGVIDNLPCGAGAIARSILADVLPNPIKRKLIPPDKDPLIALPMFGRQLAAVIIADSGDAIYLESERLAKEVIAFSFANQIVRIANQELGMASEIRPPTKSNSVSDRLTTEGKILASIFASPNFTPGLGRHTLAVMAPKVDGFVHPGRKKLREAMEAVIKKYEGGQMDYLEESRGT